MFRGPLHLRRLRNDRRHRFAPWCRIDRQGPLHIPYVHTQLSPFAPLLLCVRHGNRILVRLRLTAKRKTSPLPLRLCVSPCFGAGKEEIGKRERGGVWGRVGGAEKSGEGGNFRKNDFDGNPAKSLENLRNCKDLRVIRPKTPLAILWIVPAKAAPREGNVLTERPDRPRLFGSKVQLVKDLGCLEETRVRS
jgi:hypothetical protein